MQMNLTDLQVISKPYPILVFDNVFPTSLLLAAHATWPHLEWDNWHRYNDENSIKYGSKDGRQAPPASLTLLDMMSAFPLQDFLGPLGLSKCDFFPDFSYHAGGLHCIQPGGKLGCHIDALSHPLRHWSRVVNLILYVTPGWKVDWGGEFVLHNDDKSFNSGIAPLFNRLVLFVPTNVAYHSVAPIDPKASTRCALASFFWKQTNNAELNTTANFG